jgi:anti-sigma regulatory factor (Ser/Thr protein kinase)
MAHYEFDYASVPESEGRMMDDLTAVLDHHELPAKCRQFIMLAVSEAFTNALTHGNRYDPVRRIRIDLSVNDSQVVADIKDQGQGGLARIQAHVPPDLMSESGRGISLIRHYADRVELVETPWGGLHVHIEFDIRKNQVSST